MTARNLAALALAALVAAPQPADAISGIEGVFEYAFDAPWRIEPARDENGDLDYGLVPIQITIHDAERAYDDHKLWTKDDLAGDRFSLAVDVLLAVFDPLGLFEGVAGLFGQDRELHLPGAARIGRFCSATVTANPRFGDRLRRTFAFDDLAEVELTRGAWAWNGGAATTPPPHRVCRPAEGESCVGLDVIDDTSEWHAVAWMPLPREAVPGSEVPIEIEVLVTRDPDADCADINSIADSILLVNHVRVELGREALPRFSSGWLYGDLHYHSQGTDNEGESGYHMRGVVRAMGAMGLDFAFATDHASSSEQLMDADFSPVPGNTREHWDVLRDMDDARFRFLRQQIHNPVGVNQRAARDGGGNGREPQTRRSNGTYPQLFLGGEVDIIPEVAASEVQYGNPDRPSIPYGNGLHFDVMSLCTPEIDGQGRSGCEVDHILIDAGRDEFVFGDMQGLDEYGLARQHLVYLPRRADDADAFVASHTGEFGGGGRRLADPIFGRDPVAPQILAHGYAFLAHPLAGGGGKSLGPDLTPYFDSLLEKAFASQAILGLQFWNENTRRKRSIGWDEDFGYQRPEDAAGAIVDQRVPVNNTRLGFYVGEFELEGWRFHYGATEHDSGLKKGLAHGAYTWDRMNLWGLDRERTDDLLWLPAGEPRRVLMAGGSDAHGDFNYRREGYFVGNEALTDTALGTPRNLVHVGPLLPGVTTEPGTTTQTADGSGSDGGYAATTTTTSPSAGLFTASSGFITTTTTATTTTTVPEAELAPETSDGGSTPAPIAHSQSDVVDALASGEFTVTDGPALRIVIDRNRNGAIDAGDTPMGGVVDLYGDDSLPLLVEWKSTADFGAVERIHVYVGAHGDSGSRLYGPEDHGPRAIGVPTSYPQESHWDGGFEYLRGDDRYWRIEEVPLEIVTGPRQYVCREETVPAPPCSSHFECEFQEPETHTVCESRIVGRMAGVEALDLNLELFKSAFAEVGERFFVRAFAVTEDPHERFAYTNPIWALQRDFDACPTTADAAIDGDGDGLPDGCDPCPDAPAGGLSTCAGQTSTGTLSVLYSEPEPAPAPVWTFPVFTRSFSWFMW